MATTYKDYLVEAKEIIEQVIRPDRQNPITATDLQGVLVSSTSYTELAIEDAIQSAITTSSSQIITSGNIENQSVTTEKIKDGAVTEAKLAQEVKDYMLTPEMKQYIIGEMQKKHDEEIISLFNNYYFF